MPTYIKTEPLIIPMGGEGFADRGMIAQWYGTNAFAVMVEDGAVETIDWDEIGVKPAVQNSVGGYTTLYFNAFNECQAAIEGLDVRYNDKLVSPERHFCLTAKSKTVLGIEDQEKFISGWGEQIFFSVPVKSLKSAQKRHIFHLIFLPAIIHAEAVSKGYKVSEVHFDELNNPEFVLNEDTVAVLIGGEPFASDYVEVRGIKIEVRNGKIPYDQSLYWQQRKELWKSLGEKNPQNCQMVGVTKRDVVSSEKLNNCLNVINSKWTEPVWAKVIRVSDPGPKGVNKNGERYKIPVLVEFYSSKEEALFEAGGNYDEPTEVSAASNVDAGNALLRVPDVYEGYTDDWTAVVKEFKSKVSGPPPVVKKAIADNPNFAGVDVELAYKWYMAV